MTPQEELEAALNSAWFLAAPVRAGLRRWAAAEDPGRPGGVQAYVAGPLDGLRRLAEALGAEVRAVADAFHDIDSLRDVVVSLGGREAVGWIPSGDGVVSGGFLLWWRLRESQSRHHWEWYCQLNYLALLCADTPDPRVQELVGVEFEALLSTGRGRYSEVTKLVAGAYRLPQPPWSRADLARVAAEEVCRSGNVLVLQLLVTAGNALRRLGRDRVPESVDVFEAVLGVGVEEGPAAVADRLPPDGLAEWVDCRVAVWEAALVADVPDTAVVRFLRGELWQFVCRLVCGLGRSWADDHPDRALRLVGSFLHLPPAPPGDLSTLTERWDMLGNELTYELLRLWAGLLVSQNEVAAGLRPLAPLLGEETGERPVGWRGPATDLWALVTAAVGRALVEAELFAETVEAVPRLLGLPAAALRDRRTLEMASLGLHRADPPLATRAVAYLAFALFRTGDAAAVTNLIEAAWLVDPAVDYEPDRWWERFGRVWSGRRPDEAEMLGLFVFVVSLIQQGRSVAAAAVVGGVARGLLADDPGALDRVLGDQSAAARQLLTDLAYRTAARWNPGPWADYLLGTIGLSAGTFADPLGAAEAIRTAAERVGRGQVLERLRLVVGALEMARQNEAEQNWHPAAVVALTGYAVGVPARWDGSAEAVAPADPDPTARYHRLIHAIALADAHLAAGQTELGWAALTHVLRLTPDHLRRRGGLRAYLLAERLPHGTADEQWTPLLQTVLWALSATGREDDLEAVYASQVIPLDWLDPEGDPHPPMMVAELAETVLRVFGGRHPELVGRLARAYLRYFRDRLLRRECSPTDRRLLLDLTAGFRRELIRRGNAAVARGAGGPAGRLEQLALDQEFGQRWLLERLMLAEPMAVAPLAADPWAAAEPPPEPGPPPRRGAAAAGAARFAPVPPPPGEPVRPPAPPPGTDGGGPLAILLQTGVDESILANALAETELFLRASFSADGELLWGLYGRDRSVVPGSDTARLRLLASDDGRRDPGQHDRLRSAVDRHDEAVEAAWERHSAWLEWQGSFDRFDQAVSEGQAAPADAFAEVFVGESDADRAAFARRFERAFQLWATGQPLWCGTGGPAPGPGGGPWAAFAGGWCLDTVGVGQALDAATAAFLTEVAAVWDLSAAAPHLTHDADVLVQLDDVLHGVPPAFLPVGDRFLVELVRSARAVFGLLPTDYLREVEREEAHRQAEEYGDREPRRVASVSWFDPAADPVPRWAAAGLHRGLWVAARAGPAGAAGYNAAWTADGGWAELGELLADGSPVQVAAVCGHGTDRAPAGVVLADGVWTGSERVYSRPGGGAAAEPTTDLGRVELLLLVSCTVGRPDHRSVRGVEGFCVELAACRARAVVAGLWSLHCHDAVAFATEVAARYLALREADRAAKANPLWLPSARLRGQAVADVQRRWLADGRAAGGPAPARLNTAAGLVLFNLA